MANDDRELEDLREAFHAKGANGERRYSAEQLEDLVVFATLSAPKDGRPLPQAVTDVLGRFLARIGVSASATEAQMVEQVQSYFQAHPPPTDLAQKVVAISREETLRGSSGGLTKQMSALLGGPARAKPVAKGAGGQSMLALRMAASGGRSGS